MDDKTQIGTNSQPAPVPSQVPPVGVFNNLGQTPQQMPSAPSPTQPTAQQVPISSQSQPQGIPAQPQQIVTGQPLQQIQPAQPVFQQPSRQVNSSATFSQPVAQQPPSSAIPDLTHTQQVTSLRSPVTSPTEEKPKEKILSSALPDKSKKGGIPKPLLFLMGGFLVIIIIFLGIKLLGGFFNTGGVGKVNLTYWGLWEDKNVMQTIIDDFEKEHSNITITYTKQDPHEYSKSLITRIQNGTGPDIYRYHVSWIPMLLPSLLPLSTDVINKSDFTKAYYPVVQQDLTRNGAIYGIPLEVDTLALFINKKLLSEAKATVPTTWDEFISTARTLTTKDTNGKIQIAGAAMGTFDNITHAPDIISLLLIQNGVDLNTMTPASNASDALTFYTSFTNGDSRVWDDTLDPSLIAFERGKLAMYIGYSYDVFAIQAASPDLDFAINPVPHLPGRNSTVASYWVEGVSSKTQHPKEALLFMHYLTQRDTLAKLYTAEAKIRPFGEPYPRVDMADFLKNTPLVYPFVSQATNAESSFFAGETQDTGINAQMNGYLGNAVNSILKDTSADSAVDTLTKGVAQILGQYGQH